MKRLRTKAAFVALLAGSGLWFGTASCGPDTDRPPVAEYGGAPTGGSTRDAAEQQGATGCAGSARIVAISGAQGHYVQQKAAVYAEPGYTIELDTKDQNGQLTAVTIRVNETATGPTGSYRNLDFGNQGGLAVGSYVDAGRYPFVDPGLDLSGDGRGCNQVEGSFVVEELTYGNADAGEDAAMIASFAASFVHRCEGGDPAAIGCVRWTR